MAKKYTVTHCEFCIDINGFCTCIDGTFISMLIGSSIMYLLDKRIDFHWIMDYILNKLIIFVGDDGIHTKANLFLKNRVLTYGSFFIA